MTVEIRDSVRPVTGGAAPRHPGRSELLTAAGRASWAYDTVPARVDDRLDRQGRRRVTSRLAADLAAGRYDPAPAYFVRLPKGGDRHRLYALLSVRDRILYAALVDRLRPVIEGVVRAAEVRYARSSAEFEWAPLRVGARWVVTSDVAGSYESTPRGRLLDLVGEVCGDGATHATLTGLLDGVMGDEDGLPQTSWDSSRPLSMLYLSQLDRVAADQRWRYFRKGDNLLVAASDEGEARAVQTELEAALASLGLAPNPAATAVLPADGYQATLGPVPSPGRSRMVALVTRAVRPLPARVRHAGARWVLGTPHEARRAVRDALARSVTDDTIDDPEGGVAVEHAVRTLAATRDPSAVGAMPELLARFPGKTDHLAYYLRALVPTPHAGAVRAALEQAVSGPPLAHPWQDAWALRVLSEVRGDVSPVVLERAGGWTGGGDPSAWLRRVESIRLLGRCRLVEEVVVREAWAEAPEAFKPELLTAALASGQPWGRRLLAEVADQPAAAVVRDDRSG